MHGLGFNPVLERKKGGGGRWLVQDLREGRERDKKRKKECYRCLRQNKRCLCGI
jgi:hypothetical protein